MIAWLWQRTNSTKLQHFRGNKRQSSMIDFSLGTSLLPQKVLFNNRRYQCCKRDIFSLWKLTFCFTRLCGIRERVERIKTKNRQKSVQARFNSSCCCSISSLGIELFVKSRRPFSTILQFWGWQISGMRLASVDIGTCRRNPWFLMDEKDQVAFLLFLQTNYLSRFM